MELSCKLLRLTVNVNVGSLTQKRLSALETVLVKDFSDVIPMPIQEAFGARDPKRGITFLLTNNQVAISLEGQDVNIDFAVIGETARSIFDALLLDHDVSAWNYEFVFHGVGGSPANQISLTFLKPPLEEFQNALPGITGLGLRFLMREGKMNGEFKIEPFLAKMDVYFLNALFSESTSTTLEAVVSKGKELHRLVAEKLGALASTLSGE